MNLLYIPYIPWIFADLDTIIDSYSEAEEGE